MNQLIVEYESENTTIALLENGQLTEYSHYSSAAGVQTEQIYVGRADRIMAGLQAAFINIGKDTNGFLPLTEGAGAKPGLLRSGDRVLVQVKKPPAQGKLAFLTREISLAGRYVMLLPLSRIHGVSHRITDEALREAMMNRARQLAPENMGLVMRNESAFADDSALIADISQLLQKWQNILAQRAAANPPALIWDGEPPVERTLRDLYTLPDTIITNDAARLPAYLPCPIQAAQAPLTLHNVPKKLEKSLKKHIFLRSGGTIVVDVCEAMTVIDVNTGKFTGGKGGFAEMTIKLNCEAAVEAARILRLRKLSGIILIDFIDMESDENRNQVMACLSDALSRDRIKTVIHGFTSLGILEITRKKTEQPLEGIPEIVCPVCHGSGVLPEMEAAHA
jgi:ribonuclease G